jgi:class 3 adenylate cyclase/pimeloyl-ACP methyl ester carboxylesterase
VRTSTLRKVGTMSTHAGETDGVRYARCDDRYVAYRVRGEGPVDLLLCDDVTMVSIDSIDEEPHWARFERRLASFTRLITFDRGGIGLSDGPPAGTPLSMDRWADEALAVLDAAGSRRAAVIGCCSAGIALSLWARAPRHVSDLVLFNAQAVATRAKAEPWLQEYAHWLDETTRAERSDALVDDVAYLLPSLADDAHFRRWWKQAGQRGASPGMAARQTETLLDLDLRDVLPTVDVPTLVLCRTGARLGARSGSRLLAAEIPGARYVELPGDDFFPFSGDADAVADEIEEFLTGSRSHREVDRVLTTILFSDIVGSTVQATKLGDLEWRARLDAHDTAIRRQLDRFRGVEVNTTGDGFLARFPSPARAIECGLAMCEAARLTGVEIRVGIHTGEAELRGDDLGGIAVHIAARVLAAAPPGAVCVTSTVKDLVTGSGLAFHDRGRHELKGVPGDWQLYVVDA